MSQQHGSTVLIVTHNAALAPIANQVIHIHDGQVKKIEHNRQPAPIADIEW
jgi:putative ABC transport system ATP-binding protein